MYVSIVRPDIRLGTIALPGDPPRISPSPRAEHARLLQTAAARRLRAMERRGCDRHEDADYWIACAPVALNKAAGLRRDGALRTLP